MASTTRDEIIENAYEGISEQQIDDIVDAIHKSIKNDDFGAAIVIRLIQFAMELAEQYPSMTGKQKKKLVLTAVRRVITTRTGLDQKTKEDLLWTLDNVGPTFIDLAVSIYHHVGLHLKPHMRRNTCFGKFLRCLCCSAPQQEDSVNK